MIDYLPKLLLTFAMTAALSVGTVRLSIWLSHRLGILDRPDARKAHGEAVAYLGGLGMLLGLLLGAGAAAWLFPDLALFESATIAAALGGAVAIFLVGFWDDVRPVRALLKLLLQVVVAAAMWWLGLRIELISLLGGDAANLGVLVSLVLSIGWYVALMNSINLVDGLDGLAGGIVLLGALSLVGVSLVIDPAREVVLGAVLATLAAGAAVGFLVFNWHPAKTFMGDGGSLLLGFLLATAALVGSTKTPTVVALCVPLVALGLPLFETCFSFARRILRKQSPFKADRRHLHHRLMDVGLDQRRVVLALLFFTAFLGVNSVILARAERLILLTNIAFILLGLILLIENLKFLEKGRLDSRASSASIRSDP